MPFLKVRDGDVNVFGIFRSAIVFFFTDGQKTIARGVDGRPFAPQHSNSSRRRGHSLGIEQLAIDDHDRNARITHARRLVLW